MSVPSRSYVSPTTTSSNVQVRPARSSHGTWMRADAGALGVVDDDERSPLAVGPAPRQELLAAAVVGPAGRLARAPSRPRATAAAARAAAGGRRELGVDRLGRTAAEEHRQAHAPALELALVPQRRARAAWRRRPRRRAARSGAELGRGPRLVVVLEEAHEAGAGSRGRHRGGRAPTRRPRGAAGRTAACRSSSRSRAAAAATPGPSTPRRRTGSRGGRPGRRRSPRSSTPAPAAAPARSPQVRAKTSLSSSIAMSQRTPSAWSPMSTRVVGRRLAQPGSERVELGDVGPRREERVAAAGDDASPTARNAAGSSARSSPLPCDEVLGMLGRATGDPGRRGWARSRRAAGRPARRARRARRRARLRPPKRPVDLVAADAVRRPDDVGVGEVGQGGAERRHLLGRARAPDRTPAGLRSHTPISHTASTPAGVTRSHSSRRHVGERRTARPRPLADVVQPCRRVQLVDRPGRCRPRRSWRSSSVPVRTRGGPRAPPTSRSSGRR